MPQYTEPVALRTARTLLDVIREYPDFPIGSRRWDDRIFHPDENGGADRPISVLWKSPPAYVDQILSYVRMFEHAVVQRSLGLLFGHGPASNRPLELSFEPNSSEAISPEALL
jgi:hypothetical protein